ncbi:class I adenylate-forming enzyme family protein [Citromicrobium sp. WPS32]|uniref:class I adenylate-forming enzyme family protein n=1 Tax=Citromicrobium sp. WPS32 TaxID=1634517 RepID=UPI0006C93A19|nr:class I adenylate-forming enzyme family protein [Citromicrobium sp. WPS32]KPM18011.1 fatty acid--CoA ligase [Citromicrobium sp. WPS32]MAY78850.1 fatty acid--CoA ligase [Citromicrobium sp.]|tara:strand:+ start:22298 stop:24049 length:1752 start_codon:yes stop_codon:yes gene_type:complete
MASTAQAKDLASAIGWTPPENWPARSRAECKAILTAPGMRFEMEEVDIRGVPTRVWKNAPPNLRAIALLGQTHGEREFMIYQGERVTYDAWFRAVATLAHEFQSLGVEKGDRVALAMRNLPEWPVVFFAAVTIGAICVPLNAWWTGGELAYGLANSGTKLLVCDEERWERIAELRGECPALETVLVTRHEGDLDGASRLEDLIGTPTAYKDLPSRALPEVEILPEDDATIFYTSGTTGKPKGALGTHRNLCTNIMSSGFGAACAVLRRGEEIPAPQPKTTLTVIPLFHVTACSAGLMGSIAAGNTLIFMYRWDPVEAFQIIEREKVNSTGGVPTIAWQLLEHPERKNYDLSSIEAIAYGGAPAAPELVRKIREEFGALPGNGWGMTETMATVTGHSSEDYLNRPDSCGPPVAVADLKIMSEDGTRELPTGEIGELWARGPMVVKGYWNNPEATAETFIDGWVRTGDLARLDEEGWCYIADRAKDMIIRGGENIYSSEVENVLYDHPAVTDAALVGIPHQQLGEEPAAVVHLAPGTSASEAELQEWVAARLAKFKVPVKIAFSNETLPRNANGKILKKELSSFF